MLVIAPVTTRAWRLSSGGGSSSPARLTFCPPWGCCVPGLVDSLVEREKTLNVLYKC